VVPDGSYFSEVDLNRGKGGGTKRVSYENRKVWGTGRVRYGEGKGVDERWDFRGLLVTL
jgi:hypothetical protein